MEYEIVTRKETIVAGISARTNNGDPDMGTVISGLWSRFFHEGIYDGIPHRANEKALGIYTDYAGDERADYTVMAACEITEAVEGRGYVIRRIPAGLYARFVVRGDRIKAVAEGWQRIWQMKLPRAFQCDFEEYQNDSMENTEIHIYVGLKGENQDMAETVIQSRCGLLCSECSYREPMNCPGCSHMEKPFWGDHCPVKGCCEGNQQAHCGECEKFPCDLLTSFAYDEKQGDEGRRIQQCRDWKKP